MHKNYLGQFYTIDKKTKTYIIDVSLSGYKDIFNMWDSSKYNIRDLDDSFKDFLEECAFDIALDNKLTIRLNIKDEEKNGELEENLIKSMKNYFSYSLYITENQLKRHLKKSAIYAGISISFLTLALMPLWNKFESILSNLILESVTIGGWIFLWEFFSILFIRSYDILERKKVYKRLLESPIIFKYD